MSWLSSNLNISDGLSSLTNITGQISSFTREMLTEGTEEVADPSAELDVAKQQLRELQIVLDNQKFEYEKLKQLNEELRERAEAADLQARHVASDYREQLTRKEQEIISLKEEINKHDNDVSHGSSSNRTRHDSTDSIGEHEELKKLKVEIVRLQTECHHWKTFSGSQDSQENLHREIDQYQHELTTLQSTYSHKIANLNKKHKLEMQKWEEEKQGYLNKNEDLQNELTILEEVDNLEGMKSISHSSGDDAAALREELELAHQTISNHRQQLDRASNSFKSNENEFEKMKKQLQESMSGLEDTQQQLAVLEEQNKQLHEQNKKSKDVQILQEQLIENENNLALFSNQINLLKEQLQEKEVEMSSIGEERDDLRAKESQHRNSLNEVKKGLESLSSSTLELMEELEISQGNQEEQRIEIDSLRKVCMVKGDAKDEILHLKSIITALWGRYVATLQLYQKVRHDLHSSNQRLLAQLQARHANNQHIRQQVADVKAKLSDKNSRRQEKARKEKDQLMSKTSELRSQIDEQENVVEDLRADNQQILQEAKYLISEIGCQTANDSLDEGNDLISSLQAEKTVLESTIVGLQNKVQELKERVRVVEGEPAKADTSDFYFSEDKNLDSMDNTVDTEPSAESMESISLHEDREESTAAENTLSRKPSIEHELIIAQLNEQIEEYQANLDDFEYVKADLENDKSALEQVVINLKTQIKELRDQCRTLQENSTIDNYEDQETLLQEERDKFTQEKMELQEEKQQITQKEIQLLEEEGKLTQQFSKLQEEKDQIVQNRFELQEETDRVTQERLELQEEKERTNKQQFELEEEEHQSTQELSSLVKSVRSLEDELIGSEIVSKDDICGFDNEAERAEVLRLHLKEWVIRTRTALKDAEQRQADESMLSVSLDEKSMLEEEIQNAKKAIEELEWDNSLLREQTNDLIHRIEAKTTEAELISVQLEEKCCEVKNFGEEKEKLMTMISERDEKMLDIQDSFDSQLRDATSYREDDFDMLRDEQEGILQILAEKKKESENYKKTNEELMTSFEEKQQANEDLTHENTSLAEHVRESEMLLQDLRNEKENLLALLQSKEHLVNSLSEETKMVTVEKEELSFIVQDYQDKLHAKDQQIAGVSHLQFEVEQLALHAKESEFGKKSLEEKISALSADNERLNTSLDEKSRALNHVEHELKAKRSEVEHLDVEMDKLNELVGSNVAVRRELDHKISSLTRKKEELETQFGEKERSIDTLKLDLREKGAENDLLRLDVARVNKTLKEKEGLLHNEAESTSNDMSHESHSQSSQMLRLLQEKEQEIEAMKQKEVSLIAAVNQTDQSSHEALDHYVQQITHLTEETNRLMAELEQKEQDLINVNDRLEVIQEQMSAKAQASVVLHGQHSRLLALNESQGNEIAKVRERNDYMVKLLDEKEKSKHNEMHRMQGEYLQQFNALKQEQERLLTLVSEKDRQIVALADASTPIMAAAAAHVYAQSPLEEVLQKNEASDTRERVSRSELELKEKQIAALQGQLSNLHHNVSDKSELNEQLEKDMRNLKMNTQNMSSELQAELKRISSSVDEKNTRIRLLEDEVRTLNETLHSSKNEFELIEKSHSHVKESLSLELENMRVEKEEVLHSSNKQIAELKNKLLKAFNSLGDCTFSLSEQGFEDATNNYSAIIQRILNQRNNVLREKDNEIQTLKNQISSLNVLTQSSGTRDYELEEVLRQKEELNQQMMRMQNEREDILQDKENIVADLQSQILNLTKIVNEKERNKGHDLERLSREKEKMEKEFDKMMIEKEENAALLSQRQSELDKLTSDNNRLTNLLAEEKSNAAKLHTNSDQYTQVLQGRDNRINELSREREEILKNSDELEQRISLLQNDLSKACGGQKETEAKSVRELERLRDHLLQVEESYTREAIEAEEREKELRVRLAHAEEQILSSSHSMQDRNRQATQQLDSLQEQLHSLANQRDEAVMQLSAVQEQAQQYATSLDNLQMVLEQFQREKEGELSVVRDRAQLHINAARTDVMHIQQRENELRVQLQNAASIVHELGRLKQEIAVRDEEIAHHKASVAKLEDDLRVSHTVIRDMNSSNDNKVDKTLLRNLLNGYFNTPEGKRAEVVHVVGGLLGFSQEELLTIGTGSAPPSQGGWMSSFLPFGGAPKSPTALNKSRDADKSFSELFVNFLQHESNAAATPLQGRHGNTTNPLLTGMTATATPLNQPPTERRRPPPTSSTPLPARPPASTGVPGPVTMPTSSVVPSVFTAPVRPPGLSMGFGGISPITPMVPRMPGNSIAPGSTMTNAIRPMDTRPPPPASNPLLVGSMTPVQSLPSISSSGPSSLRNVLLEARSK